MIFTQAFLYVLFSCWSFACSLRTCLFLQYLESTWIGKEPALRNGIIIEKDETIIEKDETIIGKDEMIIVVMIVTVGTTVIGAEIMEGTTIVEVSNVNPGEAEILAEEMRDLIKFSDVALQFPLFLSLNSRR